MDEKILNLECGRKCRDLT